MLASPVEFNWLMVLLNVNAFENEDYEGDASRFLSRVKSAQPAEGVKEVLLPGEWEARNAVSNRERLAVPKEVWAAVSAIL